MMIGACSTAAANGGPNDPPASPIAASFRGPSAPLSGAAAVAQPGGALQLDFASQSFACGAPSPASGWVVVRLSIPPAQQQPGSFQIADVGATLSITSYTQSGAGLGSTRVDFQRAVVWIDTVTHTEITGSLWAQDVADGASVSGAFTAPLCAPDAG